MKKYASLLFLFTIVLFTACEGDQGPPGPPGFDGRDGQDGGIFVAETFEVDANFNPANEFTRIVNLNPVIEDGDVVLVYRLEDVDGNTPIWEPLPTATIFLDDPDQTTVLYRFNFTIGDIFIRMESSNFAAVPDDLRQDQVFRIVIVPSEFAKNNNTENLENVMTLLNIKNIDFKTLDLK